MNTYTEKETVIVYRNLGFTEDVTSCDCCGRIDLKGTYAIEDTQSGGVSYLGCVCAANRMNWSKKEFVTKYKAEEREQHQQAKKAFRQTPEYLAVEEYQSKVWKCHREGLPYEENKSVFTEKELAKIAILKQYPLVDWKFLF